MGKVVYILLLLPLACNCQDLSSLPPMSVNRNPCENFTELENITFRSPSFPGDPEIIDDKNLPAGWYAAPAGWELHSLDPGTWKTCGTRRPIYRTDEDGRQSTVCIRSRTKPCAHSFEITTQMCGKREIYRLRTPWDASGFCFMCTGRKLNILVISDVSMSITDSTFNKMKQFQQSLLGSIDISQDTNAVALMEFSSTTKVLISLGTPSSVSKADILSKIAQQQHEQGPATELADAINAAVSEVFTAQKGDRLDAENIVIMFTDGLIGDGEKADVDDGIGQLSAIAEVFVVTNKIANSVIKVIASKPTAQHVFNLGTAEVTRFTRTIMPCRLQQPPKSMKGGSKGIKM